MVMTIRVRGLNRRLVLDEPTDLPDGTELGLAVVDDADQLDDEDRAKLHAALAASEVEFRDGEAIPAEQVIAELERDCT
jgi:hypothetical protein